jgi:hypothetical protein
MNIVFKSMIDEVISGQSNIKKIIKNSANAISQTY